MPGVRPERAGWDAVGRARRHFLRIGGLAGLGLTLPGWLKARAEGSTSAARIKSCILIFYYGGPSHLDTWDMKLSAPEEIRGKFKPIATRVPGIVCGEHLPRTAEVMDKVCIVRGMHHAMTNHNSAAVEALCGRQPLRGDLELLADDELSYPCYGAIFEKVLARPGRELTSVALPHVLRNVVRLPGQDPGLLGSQYAPFQIEADPSVTNFKVGVLDVPVGMSPERLSDREMLWKHLEEEAARVDGPMKAYYERAFGLIRSPRVRQALAIERESMAIRERYGLHKLGQSTLLARRLVEAEVPFVTVYDGVHNGQDVNWDSHLKVFERLEHHLLPPADQAYEALLTDLEQRGLLDSTLVVAMGEFGRTPKVNAGAGRDHWPHCYSVLLAGGGIKGGTTYGASDRTGAYPDRDGVTPGDLAATLLWAFGVNPETEVHDKTGRPFTLATGRAVTSLFV